jgi:hypothetical protein
LNDHLRSHRRWDLVVCLFVPTAVSDPDQDFPGLIAVSSAVATVGCFGGVLELGRVTLGVYDTEILAAALRTDQSERRTSGALSFDADFRVVAFRRPRDGGLYRVPRRVCPDPNRLHVNKATPESLQWSHN